MNIRLLRKRLGLSEQALSSRAGVSRLTVRQVEKEGSNPRLQTMSEVAEALERNLLVLMLPLQEPRVENSTVVASMQVCREGFDSWPLYFMSIVDDFRKSLDPRLLLLPPVSQLDRKLTALLASIVLALCEESQMSPPSWAKRSYFLAEPWFVSETQSLKALALRDSPLAFRKNNIFVLDNFLERA